MKDSIVARRYAKSLVRAAEDAGNLRSLFDEFRASIGLLARQEVLDFWKNPGVPVSRKVAMVKDLAARIEADDKFASFLVVLAQKNRIMLIEQVFIEFTRLAREALGEVMVVVETPYDLTDEEKNDMSSILKRKLGKRIILEIKINASLIAGARVSIGDKVVDGSLKMKLAKLKEVISV